MANAYYSETMLKLDKKEKSGLIYEDEYSALVKIIPVNASLMDEVILSESAIIGLVRVALPILNTDSLSELRDLIDAQIVELESGLCQPNKS